MIRYSLMCGKDHVFESWFRDSTAFDELNRQDHVACPQCGSTTVRKAVMSPAIRRSARPASAAEPVPANPETPPVPEAPAMADVPAVMEDDRSRQMRTLIREMHARVKAHAENVGASFPAEARKIHDGDEPPRPIYGTATSHEVRSLVEDGIGIMPLPPLPDERN